MKRWLWVFALISVGAQGEQQMTAGELQEKAAAYARSLDNRSTQEDDAAGLSFVYYVMGVEDMAGGEGRLCPNGARMKRGQVFATVKKFLDDHPQRWHEPAFLLTLEGLQQLFPCSKR